MPQRGFFKIIMGALAIIAVASMSGGSAWAQTKFKTLHRFKGKDGRYPYAGLIWDTAGDLYGTTIIGGHLKSNGGFGCGTVFKLEPNPDGSWKETVLQNIYGQLGCWPEGGVIFDGAGNLYGTTTGGYKRPSTVFKLVPKPDGSWSPTLLHTFLEISDGYEIHSGLVFDATGNLYGTTTGGGAYNAGTVFQLSPNTDGSWTETVLYSFTGGSDGQNPVGGVIFDGAGNLYGTTLHPAYGTVFKLAPKTDGSWTESVLHTFIGADGSGPWAGLTFDTAGNLYGTTLGGGQYNGGVVFKLRPRADGSWTESMLHSFNGKDGANPQSRLILDASGNLYGTAPNGAAGYGVVFRLTPRSTGGWSYRVLHVFVNTPGAYPYAGVALDGVGNLYGTTRGDGFTTQGSVFEITP